jgi:hypothetical protein
VRSTIFGFDYQDVRETDMDNQILAAQEEHQRDTSSQAGQPQGQPPVVVQNNQGDGGGAGLGVFAAVALVAALLLGIWWFGFGPGAGTETPTNPASAPPAQSSAPVESVPASVAP